MIAKRYIILLFFSFLIDSTTAKNKDDCSTPTSYSINISAAEAIENGNYIVIGAYKYEKNAKRHVLSALRKGFNGRYFLNQDRGLFYVYVHRFKRKRRAFRITRKIQSYKLFDDVWVFSVGDLSTENNVKIEAEYFDTDEKELTDVVATDEETNIDSEVDIIKDTNAISKKKIRKERRKKDKKKDTVSDADYSKSEKRKSKKEIRREKRSLRKNNKNNSKRSAKQRDTDGVGEESFGDKAVSTEKLLSAEVGEFIIFDRLLFHKSSAVLKSKAREDLTILANFLKNNESNKIAIHGHTNGKFKGDIILLKKGSNNYYTLSRKNILIKGNEKRLSLERALLLKRYLVDAGIKENRIEVKGWGAKKMIYPKEHFKSSQNRRVEIEIIDK